LFTISQEFNIKTGAEYFVSVLEENGGEILRTVAAYNGWYNGMTYVRELSPSSL
jgi:soluble lytic murein transglycosylase-like protein